MMTCSEPKRAAFLFYKMVELKLAFWEMALPRLAGLVDVVAQMDDYGTQTSQLISPSMFRNQIKPRLQTLFNRIHQLVPEALCFFHSCGNVRPIVPDFIEVGVDILNPIHIRAAGMNAAELKHDFGSQLVFWGGGFVFSAVHNIQADVPPQNLESLLKALQTYSVSPLV